MALGTLRIGFTSGALVDEKFALAFFEKKALSRRDGHRLVDRVPRGVHALEASPAFRVDVGVALCPSFCWFVVWWAGVMVEFVAALALFSLATAIRWVESSRVLGWLSGFSLGVGSDVPQRCLRVDVGDVVGSRELAKGVLVLAVVRSEAGGFGGGGFVENKPVALTGTHQAKYRKAGTMFAEGVAVAKWVGAGESTCRTRRNLDRTSSSNAAVDPREYTYMLC